MTELVWCMTKMEPLFKPVLLSVPPEAVFDWSMAFYTLCVIWLVHTSSTAGNICWWPTRPVPAGLIIVGVMSSSSTLHGFGHVLSWNRLPQAFSEWTSVYSISSCILWSDMTIRGDLAHNCKSPRLIFPNQLNVVHVHVVKATCKMLFHDTHLPPSTGFIGWKYSSAQ